MKRNRTITRRLMQRRAELENRKRAKRHPSGQRAAIIRAHGRGVGSSIGTLGALGAFFSRILGGR